MKWEKGVGFLAPTEPCSKDFFTEYGELDKTPLGRVLTALRCAMACDVIVPSETLVDVGIGGGAFVEAMECKGIDVNPKALEWLGDRRWDESTARVMTFWDSLEHIENPGEYLGKCSEWVFLSTPIYEDEAAALASKHYKPNEHLWYFTDSGIQAFMFEHGFRLYHQNTLESDAGREGIGSYAFKRI